MQQLPAPDDLKEIAHLTMQLNQARDPDPEDTARLRELAGRMPDDFFTTCLQMQPVRNQLIRKMSNGDEAVRAFMLAETDRLKQQFGYAAAPPLEQTLIDHILTLRLRLIHAEMMYNKTIVDQSSSIAVGTYRDRLLATAQTRFLKAVETLTRVRRMTRNTPSLQINIAQEGGKQINLQGEGSG